MAYEQKDKELNWARDEVFIIGVNDSVKYIEKIEINIYGNPMLIYPFFSSISALYSKSHEYIEKKKKIGDKLIKIRRGLYDKKFMSDLKKDKNQGLVQNHFEKLLDDLVQVYRDMITDYTNVGMFAKINIADRRSGVVKR
ncbi:MAG: hypothetical protein OEV44_00895 [Spirochaetota bacterium]|nr:hypothetical protein [Spirochaetota bacterium]